MNKLLIILAVILIIVIIYHCFPQNMIEGFPTSSPLPNIISADNFDQYFTVDTGIANCTNASGCPSDASGYITCDGVIDWQKGKSATFRTKNPVLPSGYGFVGFKLNSVPMGKNVWNSIWLMGKDNNGTSSIGSLLEIDIYELNNTWWGNNGTNITVPKISFHDWQDGNGAKPKSDQGCFGVMLSGSTGGTNTATKQHSHCGGKIVKNWTWNLAKSQIYDGASWYTLVTKDSNNNKPLVYVGISLKGWLPKSKSEATYKNVLANSDFLVSSGEGNIQGDPRGGYFFCLTSTTSSGDVSGEWNIPCIVNYDEKAEYKDTGCPPTTKSTDCDDNKNKKGDNKSTDNGDNKNKKGDDDKSTYNGDYKSRDNGDDKSTYNDDKNQMQVSYHNGDLLNKKHKPNSYSFIKEFCYNILE